MDSYLFTEEAFRDYWNRLNDDGALALVAHEERILMRFVATGYRLFEELHLPREEFAARMAVISGGRGSYNHLFVLRKSAFTPTQAATFGESAEAVGLRPQFIPGLIERPPYAGLLSGEIPLERFVSRRIFDFRTCTDDEPFCFDPRRDSVPAVLSQLFALTLMLTVFVFAVGAWLRTTRRTDAIAWPRAWPYVGYFLAIGAGFMLIELALIQYLTRLLGFGIVALALVLAALLVGGGLGSFVSMRIDAWASGRGMALAGISVAVLAALQVASAGTLEDWLVAAALPTRIALVAPLLLSFGFALGLCFPLGLQSISDISPVDVPWMWALNGAASVLGSVATVTGARLIGFDNIMISGALLYGVVALLGWKIQRDPRAANPDQLG
jgi:hypothetical protein